MHRTKINLIHECLGNLSKFRLIDNTHAQLMQLLFRKNENDPLGTQSSLYAVVCRTVKDALVLPLIHTIKQRLFHFLNGSLLGIPYNSLRRIKCDYMITFVLIKSLSY